MIYDFEELFEIIEFPSSETHVRLKLDVRYPKKDDVILKRCINWNDVMHVVSANEILKRNHTDVKWLLPFRPFARQDRVTATNHGHETMLLEHIFDLNDIKTISFDVHSNCERRMNFTEISQLDIVDYVLEKRGLLKPSYSYEHSTKYDILWVVPDEGAHKKIKYQLKEKNRYYGTPDIEFVVCSKKRDPATGKLSGFSVPVIDKKVLKKVKEVFIIDDICDGGGTFLAIADQLKPQLEPYKKMLNLFVTHGIFSNGLEELYKKFDRIITTNSINANANMITLSSVSLFVYDIKQIFNEFYK